RSLVDSRRAGDVAPGGRKGPAAQSGAHPDSAEPARALNLAAAAAGDASVGIARAALPRRSKLLKLCPRGLALGDRERRLSARVRGVQRRAVVDEILNNSRVVLRGRAVQRHVSAA